ncbi:MAG: diaminopimelate epimerase [Flavobacteriales bacterium]|nr:diaminopimelate epimerase [Flavobacteriales bacterium]
MRDIWPRMVIPFSKWHGTGNDFILIDDRLWDFPAQDVALIQRLCDRHFGIGSDGLILIQPPRSAESDYHMEFFNPDGSRSFCGNGSRCAFAFWRSLVGDPIKASFTAIDGSHEARWVEGQVRISMKVPGTVEGVSECADLIHTGSPHLLVWVDDPEKVEIIPDARHYRYNERFSKEGVNVNFLRVEDGRVEMRTYERGVEGETLSCGTGVTAAAIDALHRGFVQGSTVVVRTRGGDLRVEVRMDGDRYASVDLIGPVRRVFDGSYRE